MVEKDEPQHESIAGMQCDEHINSVVESKNACQEYHSVADDTCSCSSCNYDNNSRLDNIEYENASHSPSRNCEEFQETGDHSENPLTQTNLVNDPGYSII